MKCAENANLSIDVESGSRRADAESGWLSARLRLPRVQQPLAFSLELHSTTLNASAHSTSRVVLAVRLRPQQPIRRRFGRRFHRRYLRSRRRRSNAMSHQLVLKSTSRMLLSDRFKLITQTGGGELSRSRSSRANVLRGRTQTHHPTVSAALRIKNRTIQQLGMSTTITASGNLRRPSPLSPAVLSPRRRLNRGYLVGKQLTAVTPQHGNRGSGFRKSSSTHNNNSQFVKALAHTNSSAPSPFGSRQRGRGAPVSRGAPGSRGPPFV